MTTGHTGLRITEIFVSIQGESTRAGLPTVFIRLTGCPLRCNYCDTAYAFEGGTRFSIDSILEQARSFGTPYVTVTGGEPLAQPECLHLLRELCDAGFEVSLETSGALPLDEVDQRVSCIMDLKTPSSGECHRNLYENIPLLKPTDEIKFVVANRADFDWCKSKMIQFDLPARVQAVLLSPVHESLAPAELAEWMLADRVPARLQLQLHKLVWSEARGR